MEHKHLYDITIIGGGIVGMATAYKLQCSNPTLSVLILEKEDRLAAHQTGHNSGVLHSGIYYTPGSLKAENCVQGRQEMVAFAKANQIPHEVCGKIIVATQKEELPALDKIFQNGLDNGLKDIRKISPQEITDIEPYCEGLGGIWVGEAGIIDYGAVTEKFQELIQQINSQSGVKLGQQVLSFGTENGTNLINTNSDQFRTKKMIFCGGLFADRLARKHKVELKERVVGFRGDYYELTKAAEAKVRNLIYPVPNLAFPFLGVHFTRMVNGGVECGPNAVFSFKREGYGKLDFNLRDSADALSYQGTWRLFQKNWRFGLKEYQRAFSKKRFLANLQQLIPSLKMEDIHPGRSGVRAVLLNADGDTRTDFRIVLAKDSIHVLNAPSPAATAALAIGAQITEMAQKEFGL